MNHNELKELRNQLKLESRKMYLSNIATAYIVHLGGQATIQSFALRHFDDLSEEDADMHIKMAKKVLSGKPGKNILEYKLTSLQTAMDRQDAQSDASAAGSERDVPQDTEQEEFSDESDEEIEKKDHAPRSNPLEVFYALNAGRLQEEEGVRKFIRGLTEAVDYTSNFYITLMACEYKVPVLKKSDGEEDEEAGFDGNIHRFTIVVFSEVSPADLGLYYNEAENRIEYKTQNDLHVLPTPLDGLIYPAFTDRQTDINHILYWTKNTKKPNSMLLENVLGVTDEMSHDQMSDSFSALIEDVAGEELNLEMYKKIVGSVRDVVKDEEAEDELQTLSKAEIRDILESSGIPENKMMLYSGTYDETIGEQEMKAINMVDTDKMQIKAADVTVNVKAEAAYKVKTRMIDGGLYLCIAVDDGLKVNGLDIKK